MQNHANHTQTHTYKCKMQTTQTHTRARAHTHTHTHTRTHTPHECKIQTTHTQHKCKMQTTHTHTQQHNTTQHKCTFTFWSFEGRDRIRCISSAVGLCCAPKRTSIGWFLFMQAWHHDSFFNLCVLQVLIFSFFDLRLTNLTKIFKKNQNTQDMNDVRVHLPRHIHANRSINRSSMFAFCQLGNAVPKFYT